MRFLSPKATSLGNIQRPKWLVWATCIAQSDSFGQRISPKSTSSRNRVFARDVFRPKSQRPQSSRVWVALACLTARALTLPFSRTLEKVRSSVVTPYSSLFSLYFQLPIPFYVPIWTELYGLLGPSSQSLKGPYISLQCGTHVLLHIRTSTLLSLSCRFACLCSSRHSSTLLSLSNHPICLFATLIYVAICAMPFHVPSTYFRSIHSSTVLSFDIALYLLIFSCTRSCALIYVVLSFVTHSSTALSVVPPRTCPSGCTSSIPSRLVDRQSTQRKPRR